MPIWRGNGEIPDQRNEDLGLGGVYATPRERPNFLFAISASD